MEHDIMGLKKDIMPTFFGSLMNNWKIACQFGILHKVYFLTKHYNSVLFHSNELLFASVSWLVFILSRLYREVQFSFFSSHLEMKVENNEGKNEKKNG